MSNLTVVEALITQKNYLFEALNYSFFVTLTLCKTQDITMTPHGMVLAEMPWYKIYVRNHVGPFYVINHVIPGFGMSNLGMH